MSTHVIQLDHLPQDRRSEFRLPLDPARTWLMVAIAGSVLAASLLIASGSIVDDGSLGPGGAAAPQPGPAPTLTVGREPTAPTR